jgi:hypothetical protein
MTRVNRGKKRGNSGGFGSAKRGRVAGPGRPKKYAEPLPIPTGKFDADTIRDLASRGHELDDICVFLRIDQLLAGRGDLRGEAERAHREGRAQFRITVQEELLAKARSPRGSNAIKALAENYLAAFQEEAAVVADDGLVDRVNAAIEKVKALKLKSLESEENPSQDAL